MIILYCCSFTDSSLPTRTMAACSVSTGLHKLTLTYLSPAFPKIPPGVINTPALYNTSSLKWYPSFTLPGTLAQTNKPACCLSYVQLKASSRSNTFSRLSLYTLFTSSCQSFPNVNALAAASCTGKNIPLSMLLLNRNTSSIFF